MEGGIFLCHWYFLLKAYLRKRRDASQRTEGEPAGTPKVEEEAAMGSNPPHSDVPLNPIFSQSSHSEV
jgi:hypothetical protein